MADSLVRSNWAQVSPDSAFFEAFAHALIGIGCKVTVFRGPDAAGAWEIPEAVYMFVGAYHTTGFGGSDPAVYSGALAAWAVHKYGLEALDAMYRLAIDGQVFADQIADEWEKGLKPDALRGVARALA